MNKLISRRDDIIAGLTEGTEMLYDTSALEAEKKRLFINTLLSLPQKVTKFSPETWGKLLDHVTVYTDGSIRCTFCNGIQI